MPLFIACVISLCLVSGLRAEDWPQWRGARRDGTWRETGLLTEFPVGGLKVKWRVPVGNGFSTPCVAQGRVYLTDSEVTTAVMRETVRCLDAATGKTIWTHTYKVQYPEWGADPAHPFGPAATPAIDGSTVYTFGRMSHLLCLDTASGRVLWGHDLPKEYQTTEDLRGPNCSPIVDEKRVIIAIAKSPKASIVAFDKNSGSQIWEALDEIPSNSSPIFVTAAGRRQLIVWAYKSVAALDPVDGRILWRVPVNTGSTYTVATPVWSEDRLLLGGLMLKLRPDSPDASILWPEDHKPSRIHLSDTSTAVFQGGLIFAPTSKGQILCLEAATGKELWKAEKVTESKSGASIHMTWVPGIQACFLFTDRGDLVLARLNAEGYREISRAHLIEPTNDYGGIKMAWTPPAYANRCVFARNDKELVCASLAALASSRE